MSADNGVYILVTNDSHQQTDEHGYVWMNMLPEGITTFRVAYSFAIDNLEWTEKNEYYNTGAYLQMVWGESQPFYCQFEAHEEAERIAREVGHLEHGIQVIERLQYNFPR